jgi:3-isopropylmalate/(R)-2-methylmalate dehydratase large subunit
MAKTIAEKILTRKSGKDVTAGELVLAEVDYTMSQDGTSALVIDALKELGVEKIKGATKWALVIDHSAPSPLAGVSEIHKKMRDFAKLVGAKIYDISEGICHQLLPESGHVLPGGLVVGADSHTCTYGALNAAGTGVGSADLAAAVFTGKLWLKVPESIEINLTGKLPLGIFSKDIILFLIGQMTADGATYKSVEFVGPIIDELSMDGRFTIANMAVEVGAKFGLMKADQKTFDWLKKQGVTKKLEPVEADKDAVYSSVLNFDLSKMSPQVAKPHQVDYVSPVEEVEGTTIQQGVIGTCTNGRLEDLEIAAKILAGKKIHPDCRLIIVPASKKIYLEAMKKGFLEIFIEAGAVVVNPGCGPCVGTHQGIPASGEKVISTANRNFLGRMGNNQDVGIFLASPATVAASVLNAEITDPRRYL